MYFVFPCVCTSQFLSLVFALLYDCLPTFSQSHPCLVNLPFCIWVCVSSIWQCVTHVPIMLCSCLFLVFWTFLPQAFWICSRFGLTLWFGPLPAFIIFCLRNHCIGLTQPLAAPNFFPVFLEPSFTE